MPFGIVTHSGVTITHTGANPPMAGIVVERPNRPSYRDIVERVDGYNLADFFDDYSPQIGEVFGQNGIGSYLWDVFFNGNETEFSNCRTYISTKRISDCMQQAIKNFNK